jgi:hypothetical protein
MSWFTLLKTFLILVADLKSFFLGIKKKQIKDLKDEALETGDQRKFEKSISDIPNELPSDKYPRMYERPIKKKS